VPPGNGDGGNSTNQANFGRPGGVGAPSTIRNTARHFAGGGGGSGGTGNTTAFYSGGKGGFEGGGFGRNGGESPGIAPSGEINTGGGGGASTQPGSAAAPAAASGAGGSGIVIVKEKDKASGVFNMSAQYNSNKSGKWPSRQSFEVPNSIMFNTADSAYLNHQPSSGDGLTKYTISAWCKISQGFGSSSRWLFGAGSGSGDNDYVLWTSGDVLKHSFDTEGSGNVIWAAKFRDPAAWQHIVVMVDTTDAVAANRVRAYANGIELNKSGESYPSQNYVTSFGKGSIDHRIGARAYSATGHYGGYICEFNFIAGQALKPGHFGEVDPDSPNIWRPKKYNGTYGDAGAYLEFKQSAVGSGSASTIGADTSGNGNHYTSTNVATTDQMTDTCTNNFANFNPLIAALEASGNATTPSFSEGNLRTVTANAGKAGGSSTIQMNTGKWYAEFEFDATNNSGSTITSLIGVTDSAQLNARSFGKVGERANDVAYAQTGNKVIGDSSSSFGNTYTTGDVIGVAVDLDNNAIYFSKNGTFQNSGDPTSGSSKTGAIALTDPASTVEGGYYFAVGESTTETSTHIANFGSPVYSISTGNTDANGHGNFEYAVPSGYFALCTKNLAQYG
jgi:hypothetical protein